MVATIVLVARYRRAMADHRQLRLHRTGRVGRPDPDRHRRARGPQRLTVLDLARSSRRPRGHCGQRRATAGCPNPRTPNPVHRRWCARRARHHHTHRSITNGTNRRRRSPPTGRTRPSPDSRMGHPHNRRTTRRAPTATRHDRRQVGDIEAQGPLSRTGANESPPRQTVSSALMTRRSQVQIPPRRHHWRRKSFRGAPAGRVCIAA